MFELVHSSDGTEDDLQVLLTARPEIVLVDFDQQEATLGLVNALLRQIPRIKVAAIATAYADLLLWKLLQLAIPGLLLKSDPVEALFEHLRRLGSGENSFSPTLGQQILLDPQRRRYSLRRPPRLSELSDLQRDIVRHLALGDSLKMVASKLRLSRKSIDGHKYRIMQKLDVGDRVLLCRLAIREGLIQP